jgi:hypothetical protein
MWTRTGQADLLTAVELELDSPPALKPNGARHVMKRLSEEENTTISDGLAGLEPHGGRQEMGEVFVRQFGFAKTARFLGATE